MTDTTYPVGATVAEAEHRAHLRRAVVASTVGTTIEWYDFLIYSTMTGLVFGHSLLCRVRPADRYAEGLRRFLYRLCRAPDRRRDLRPLRRPHRPQGHLDRNPADDRDCDRCGRAGSRLRDDRHLGRGHPDPFAPDPGDWRRRRVGRLGPAGDGMGARPTRTVGSSPPGRNSARPPDCSWPIWRC